MDCTDTVDREVKGKWTTLRLRTERLAASYGRLAAAYGDADPMDYGRRAANVVDCGTYLGFARDSGKLREANFCRDRLCPMCNSRRSAKIYSQVSRMMDWIDEHHGYKYIFLTLTLRNCAGSDLGDTISLLLDSWRRMCKYGPRKWRNVIKGTHRTLEVTVNARDGSYHPHLHAILAVEPDYFAAGSGKYITQRQYRQWWQDAAGLDYDPWVNVQLVRQDDRTQRVNAATVAAYTCKDEDMIGLDDTIAGHKMLREVSKNPVKTQYIVSDDDTGDVYQTVIDRRVDDIYRALRGRRLVGWSGVYYQARRALSLDDAEAGDLIHLDDDDVRGDVGDAIVRYGWRGGVYVRL